MWTSFALLTILAVNAFAATDKIVCYHGSWANYRQGTCRYTVDNIDPFLCTHIMYGFVGINADGTIRIMDSWLDIDLAALTRFTGLKKKNPNLKALVAIGGWNEGSTKFSTVAASSALRGKLIQSAVSFLQTYGFDGFDLDWEYPAQRGGTAADKVNFSKLLAEFRAEFDKYGFLLTAAVAACSTSADISYEIPELSRYLDFINVMTYDIHGAWDPVTGHNAPLYTSSVYTLPGDKALNVDACVAHWITRGAAREKLILGVGTYGRTFQLSNANNHGILAPTVGGGASGQCTGEAGILGYNEICLKLKTGGCKVIWDDEQQVPYAVCGNQWIGYDDSRSIALKAQYARNQRLGGVMVWSVETDDFNGACGEVNVLLKTIRNTLELPEGELPDLPELPEEPETPEVPENPGGGSSSTTTSTTQSPPAGGGAICTTTGYVRDPNDCSVFYQCVANGGGFIEYRFICPTGLHFDPSITACNYPYLVICY